MAVAPSFWAGLGAIADRPCEEREPTPRNYTGCRLGRPPKSEVARLVRPSLVVGKASGDRPRPADPWGLTEREAGILDMFVQGMNTAQIATKVHRSERTVAHHATSIYKKLGVTRVAQAVYAWHKHYQVVGTVDTEAVNKDHLLINSLIKATADKRWSQS